MVIKMRGTGRRWLAALLAAMLMLAGCGKESEEAAALPEDSKEEYVYVGEYRSLSQDGYFINNAVIGKDGQVFYVGNSEEGCKLFTTGIDEETISELALEAKGNTQAAIGSTADGQLVLGLIQYQEGAAADTAEHKIESVLLRKIDADGKLIEETDTGNTFLNIPDFYIQSILTDKDGNYYICTGQSVYVLNSEGELYFEASAEDYISGMFPIRDEKIAICYLGNNGWQIEEIDVAKKELKPLDSSITFDYGSYQSGTETDLLYTMGSVLYTCNLTDVKPQRILDWVDCDINSNYLKSYRILEDGRIAAVTMDWSSENGETELAVLTKKNRADVPQKKVLVYGSWYIPYFTNQDIVAFNKQSDEYRIEIKQYGDENTDFETRVSLFNADIAEGKGPDIIDLQYCPLSFQELSEKGVLEDLTPYLEMDKELKKEDYLQNVLKAYEAEGKLYGIMPFFGIRTLVGKTSEVGEASSWTIDEMMDYIERKKGPDVEILPYYTKAGAIHLMCSYNLEQFVNWENGTCDFTGEEFKKILKFSEYFPVEAEFDANAPSEIEKVRSGKQLLAETVITSVQLYQMYEYMFNEPVNFIGYPTLGKSGMILSPNATVAGMNVNSENKEGVWEFLRFNLTKERQENVNLANDGFPIMSSVLEKQLEEDRKAEYYEDADGNQKENPKGTWGNGDFSIDVYAATEEQIARVREMITAAVGDNKTDDKILSIIIEEAQPYFNGQKSEEEVAAMIQNRVQTYLSETL